MSFYKNIKEIRVLRGSDGKYGLEAHGQSSDPVSVRDPENPAGEALQEWVSTPFSELVIGVDFDSIDEIVWVPEIRSWRRGLRTAHVIRDVSVARDAARGLSGGVSAMRNEGVGCRNPGHLIDQRFRAVRKCGPVPRDRILCRDR
jgi:hypothetical protein